MNTKMIRVSVVCGRIFFNLDDLAKAFGYPSIEAALRTTPDTSVCKIEYGDVKSDYVDANGMYDLITHSDTLNVPNDWVSKCKVIAPQDNAFAEELSLYPNSMVLIIHADKHTDEIQPSNLYKEALYSISEIAEDYGMSARKLNLFLELKGVQHRKGNRWYVYRKYQKKGYIGYKHHKLGHMYWTIDGMLFIISLLEAEGYERKGED